MTHNTSHNPVFRFLQSILLIGWLAFTATAFAGPGHDHGPTPSATSQSSALPKAEGQSELFELLARVDKNALRIYLDRYADNEPVRDAVIEVQAVPAQAAGSSASVALSSKAVAQADGSYLWSDPGFALPGLWTLTFTITQGNDADLLVATLDASDLAGAPAADGLLAHLGDWLKPLIVLATGVALLVGVLAYRKSKRSVSAVALTVVMSLVVALAGLMPEVSHAHGDEPAAKTADQGNAPRRQSDGSVYLPKNSQRQLEIRTMLATTSTVAKTLELNGRVVMDPNAGGRVQSAQGGRIEPGPRGMPSLGQVVRKGEVLAYVRPSAAPIEQSNQAAAVAENAINLRLAEQRLNRLEQLQGSVPQRDIDTARAEVAGLRERGTLTRASLVAVEPLLAPVSGVIATMSALAGQVVASTDVLFEIVDPQRLRVEALVYDPSLAADLSHAVASLPGNQTHNLPLRLIGAGRVLREQAMPLQFRIEPAPGQPLLALGQPLVVRAELKSSLSAIRVAASGLVKSPSNQDMVWVHTRAEVFEPRVVRWQALDASTVAVTQGLSPGDRVVVRGTSLINQVR